MGRERKETSKVAMHMRENAVSVTHARQTIGHVIVRLFTGRTRDPDRRMTGVPRNVRVKCAKGAVT